MAVLTQSDRYVLAAKLKAFLGQPAEAEVLLTSGLSEDPRNAVLLRERGHRRITLRNFRGAQDDLENAVEAIEGTQDQHEFYQRDIEPDLVHIILGREDLVRDPHLAVNDETNAATAGMYKSTLHGSVWYHLGVVRYLMGDFMGALAAMEKSATFGVDDDASVATFDWRYMSLRRLGRVEEAEGLLAEFDTDSLSVASGQDFYLRRLRLYKGESSPVDVLEELSDSPLALATQGYGVGNWYLYNGDRKAALKVFENVVQEGAKNAFGYIAAEVELERW